MKESVKKWFKIGKPPGKLESIEYIYDVALKPIKFMKIGTYNDRGVKRLFIMGSNKREYEKDIRFLRSLFYKNEIQNTTKRQV